MNDYLVINCKGWILSSLNSPLYLGRLPFIYSFSVDAIIAKLASYCESSTQTLDQLLNFTGAADKYSF